MKTRDSKQSIVIDRSDNFQQYFILIAIYYHLKFLTHNSIIDFGFQCFLSTYGICVVVTEPNTDLNDQCIHTSYLPVHSVNNNNRQIGPRCNKQV